MSGSVTAANGSKGPSASGPQANGAGPSSRANGANGQGQSKEAGGRVDAAPMTLQ
jgi:hypothetical protein